VDPHDQLIHILQTAISPVVMISGVGLLLLSLTNRFARTTERARGLAAQRREADAAQRPRLHFQVQILYRRSRILMLSTIFALSSVLSSALLIVTLFVYYVTETGMYRCVAILFTLSQLSLVASLTLFIQDMTVSLRALREELSDRWV
jgi:hypothetical protein